MQCPRAYSAFHGPGRRRVLHSGDEAQVREWFDSLSRHHRTGLSFACQGIALGIADGVGGWNESGVNPALFATALMYYGARYCKEAFVGEATAVDGGEDEDLTSSLVLDPRECLRLAYESVLRDDLVEAGKSLFGDSSRT